MSYLIILVIAIIVYSIYKNINNNASTNNDSENSFTITFQRNIDSRYKLEKSERVNLWNKPESNEIRIYCKDSRIYTPLAFGKNDKILNHLRNNGLYDAIINSFSNSTISINIHLYEEYKGIDDYRQEQKERWKGQLIKKYNPKREWILRYTFIGNLDKKMDYRLGYTSFDKTLDKIDNDDIASSIWIEDSVGNIVSEINHSGSVDTIKTLRTIYSGKNFELQYYRKEGIYQWFRCIPIN